jgi:hypothetical protein
MSYPTHHLVAVLDTAGQVADAVQELTTNGFPISDIQVGCGTTAADALAATTGRKGLAGLAVRVAEAIGYENFEMRVKAVVEQALRDGRFVVLVPVQEEERKDLAVRILTTHGAHTVSYHDRLTIEAIVPPKK